MENPFSSFSAKRNLVFAEPDFHFALVLQKAVELVDRFGRNDKLTLAAFGHFHFLIHQGQAAPVGRHHGHLVVLEADEDAVQDVARFVSGDGKGGLLEHALDLGLGQDDFLVSP